jgi:hypothetical protein
MTRITFTPEQARIFVSTEVPIEVCDPQGKVLGTIHPPKLLEVIAECKRRAKSAGPWVTGAQVQETLRVLQETWDKEGPFGKERALEILHDLRNQRGA